jgi:HEAT repeat protein
MYDDDDLTLLDIERDLESPLDQLEPIGEDVVLPQPDPQEMLQFLESPDVQQRMLAARAFCELEEPQAAPLLTRLWTEDCPLVRVSAAYALGRNPSSDAVVPLIEQLHQDWNGYVRKGIVWALGNCHDRRSLPPLIDALKTDISAVRLWAASSLAQMVPVGYDVIIAAIPPLIEALRHDAIAAVRSNCGWSLGQLCRELPSNVVYATAVDALIESMVDDPDIGVREDAKAALLKLGDPRALQLIADLEQEGFIG